MKVIALIDYATGNLDSINKAVKLFEKNVIFTKNPKDLDKASKIILPGQGSYNIAINSLKKSGMFKKIIDKSSKENIPILGICLGMQIMSTTGFENNLKTEGLNLIPGEVVKLKSKPNKLPHIGWSTVNFKRGHHFFKNIENNKDFYFLHSFKFIPKDIKSSFGQTNYNEKFSSIVSQDLNFGVQFHPEKSLNNGLKIIKNFVELKK